MHLYLIHTIVEHLPEHSTHSPLNEDAEVKSNLRIDRGAGKAEVLYLYVIFEGCIRCCRPCRHNDVVIQVFGMVFV